MAIKFPWLFFGLGGGDGAAASLTPDAGTSTIELVLATVPSGSPTTVTVTVRDVSSIPITGASVELTTDGSGAFTAASGITDVFGQFVTQYTPDAVGSGTHNINAEITSNAVTIDIDADLTVTVANLLEPMTDSPTCIAVVTTPERFIFALGADGDPRKVMWPSQETMDDWTPAAENTAGDHILETNGRIRCGRRGRGETLVWTDTDLHAARYIGGTLLYSWEQLGSQCGIIAPNAVAMMDGKAVWMSHKGFFVYDGFVKPLPCEVFDHVFVDFNYSQRAKVAAGTIAQYGEVWFHYPSAASQENDRYVVWNYRENHWSAGELARTAHIDRGAFEYPMMASPDGYAYDHERGQDREGTVVYAETGPIALDSAERVMRVNKLIPDERTLGDVQAYLFGSYQPTDDEVELGPFTLTRSTSVRLTARYVRLRLEEVRETDWRVGILSLDMKQMGKR